MPPPEGWKVSFTKMHRRYEDHRDDMFDFLGETLEHGVYERFLACMRRRFPMDTSFVLDVHRDDPADEPEGDKADVLNMALSPYYGKDLTEERAEEIGWRIAASYDLLIDGHALRPTIETVEPHWVPLQVLEVTAGEPLKTGRPALELVYRVLGGVFSGLTFRQRTSKNYVLFQLARDMGFPRFKALHHLQLCKAMLVGLLETKNLDRICISETYTPDSVVRHNRGLRRAREDCPYDYSWPCHECTRGYLGMNSCPMGTHPSAYVKRECTNCARSGKVESWFDPKIRSDLCIRCREHELKIAFAR